MTVSRIDDNREIREWLTKLPEENRTSYTEAVVHMVINHPVVATSVRTRSKARHFYTALEILGSFDVGEDKHPRTDDSATLVEDGSSNLQAGGSHDCIVFLEGRHLQWLDYINVSMDTNPLDPLAPSTKYKSREYHTEQLPKAVLHKRSNTLLHATSKQQLWPVFAYRSSSVSPDWTTRLKKVLAYEFMGYYVLNALNDGTENLASVRRMLAHVDSLKRIPEPEAPKKASKVSVDGRKSRNPTSGPFKSTKFFRESTDELDHRSDKNGDQTSKRVHQKPESTGETMNSDERRNIIIAQKNWRSKDNKLDINQPDGLLQGEDSKQKAAQEMAPRSISTVMAPGPPRPSLRRLILGRRTEP